MSGGMVSGRKGGCDCTCEGGTQIYALGGVIGAGITWTVVKSMASLGPAKAALLIVISQLIVAYVIELLGMFGVEKSPFAFRKLAGLVVALIGIAIFQWE